MWDSYRVIQESRTVIYLLSRERMAGGSRAWTKDWRLMQFLVGLGRWRSSERL